MFWIPLAIAGGTGLLNYMQQKKEFPKQVKLQSEIARYSPWTGMHPNLSAMHRPSLFGSMGRSIGSVAPFIDWGSTGSGATPTPTPSSTSASMSNSPMTSMLTEKPYFDPKEFPMAYGYNK